MKCFVIMPFSSTPKHTATDWNDVYENLFRPTMETFNFECAKSTANVGIILRGIIEAISSSAVILVDLTDAKPNVFYELGIAHAITNNVIMVSQNIDDVSSDIRHYGVIKYDMSSRLAGTKFTRDISQALQKVFAGAPPASPVYEYLGRTHRRLQAELQSRDGIISNPIAILECSKCHRKYEVPVNSMGHGGGDHPNLCQHWEPAIFRGIKNAANLQVFPN